MRDIFRDAEISNTFLVLEIPNIFFYLFIYFFCGGGGGGER